MKGDQLTKRHKGSYLLTNQMTGLRFGIGISAEYPMKGWWCAYLKSGLKGEVLHYGRTRRECLQFIEKYQENYVAEMAMVLRFQAHHLPLGFPDKYQLTPKPDFLPSTQRGHFLYACAPFDFVEVTTSPDPDLEAIKYKMTIYIYGHGIFNLALQRDMVHRPAWYYDLLDMADRWLALEKE